MSNLSHEIEEISKKLQECNSRITDLKNEIGDIENIVLCQQQEYEKWNGNSKKEEENTRKLQENDELFKRKIESVQLVSNRIQELQVVLRNLKEEKKRFEEKALTLNLELENKVRKAAFYSKVAENQSSIETNAVVQKQSLDSMAKSMISKLKEVNDEIKKRNTELKQEIEIATMHIKILENSFDPKKLTLSKEIGKNELTNMMKEVEDKIVLLKDTSRGNDNVRVLQECLDEVKEMQSQYQMLREQNKTLIEKSQYLRSLGKGYKKDKS